MAGHTRHMVRRYWGRSALLAALVALGATWPVQAQWSGWGSNDLWSNSANWYGWMVPASGWNANFGVDATVDFDGRGSCDDLCIGWKPTDEGKDVVLVGQPGKGYGLDAYGVEVPGKAWPGGDACTVVLRNGVVVTCAHRVGVGSYTSGALTVEDARTVLDTPLLVVGDEYTSQFTIRNGAQVRSDEVQVGLTDPDLQSLGTQAPCGLTLTGSGSTWEMNSLTMGTWAKFPGEVWIRDSGSAWIKQQLNVGQGCAVHLAGGTLRIDAPFSKPSGTLDFASGTLKLYFPVVAEANGPLGSVINLGAGKYLVATSLRLPAGGQLNLQGGRVDTGTLTKAGGSFGDTASSTTSVSALSGFDTFRCLGMMRIGDYSTGDVTVGESGKVLTLTVDRSLTVASGMLYLYGSGQATVGESVALRSTGKLQFWGGGKLTTRSLDLSAVTSVDDHLYLDQGTLTIDGGALKGPNANFDLAGTGSTMTVVLKNGATAQIAADFAVGQKGPATVTQTGGTVNVARTLRLGQTKDPSQNIDARGTYTLEGGGQLNANGGYMVVGYQGQGTVNLNSGTNRAAKYLYIGETSTGRGTYDVNGGTLTVGDGLYIGGNSGASGGTGTLTLASGSVSVTNTLKLWNQGTLNCNGGSLSVGTLDRRLGTFTWPSGTLTFTKELAVGPGAPFGSTVAVGANQTIAATAGARVTAGGTLTASGGGQVDASGKTINVGYGSGGQGALSVADGGTVLAAYGNIGCGDASGVGTVTVSGTGRWTHSSELAVGRQGQGTLTIQSGGTVSDTTGRLAYDAGSQGTATVDGGTWTNSSFLGVGRGGSGALTIQNGGRVTNTDTLIGYCAGATGTLTVTGSGTTYSPTGNVCIGGDSSTAGGTGTLIADSYGQVTVPGTLRLWSGGTVSILHPSAKVTTRSLDVRGGTFDIRKGTFTVDGGTFTAPVDVTVQGGDNCQFYVKSGTQGNLSARLTVGDATTGRLHQVGGGVTLGGTLTLGVQSGVTGQYSLRSASTLTGTTLVAGAAGKGYYSQTGGTAYFSSNLYLGNNAGGYGECSVNENDGTDSSLSVAAAVVGNQGQGHLQHLRGTLEVRGDLYLGYASGGLGNYSLNAGTDLATVKGISYLGYAGTGKAYLSNGIHTNQGMIRMGNNAGAEGYCKISGSAELRCDGGYEVVGYKGKATVEQTAGLNRVTGNLFLAEQSTASGTYTMSGGSLTVSSNMCVGGNNSAAGGPASVTLSAGTVRVTGTLRIWAGGTVTMTGGDLYADVVDNTHGGTFNLNGGTLHVREFQGNLVNNGGTVAPGSSPGTMTITGNYTQGPGGTLQIELSSVYDILAVAGQLKLGGQLQVLPYGSFSLTSGLSFDCLNWGALAGQFDVLSLPSPSRGVSWDLSELYNTGTLSLASLTGPFAITGTVRDAALNGLAGVTVTATGTGTASTATDAQGNYTLSLPIGAYTITPFKLGSAFLPASRALVVAGPQAGVDFAVGTATYCLRGTAHDAAGNTLAGVTVTAGSRSATTGTDGAYLISGLVAGSYSVTPAKTGYTFAPAQSQQALSADVSGVDFVGTLNTFGISGTVVDGSGQPLVGVAVLSEGQSVVTGDDGAYALTGLFAGSCTVAPVLAGYTFSPASQAFTLAADRLNVGFVGTADPYAVSGTVTAGGQPLAGATVTAGSFSTTTQADGTYTLVHLAAGTYTVEAHASDLTFAPADQSVTVGPSSTGIDFAGSATRYTVSGTITDGTGPLAGVTVSADGTTAVTQANGTYTLTGLTAGPRSLVPALAGYVFTPESKPLVLGPDQAGVDFTAVAAPYTVSGAVHDASGAAVADVLVALSGTLTRSTTTDATGAYAFADLLAGTYTVTPGKAEYGFAPVQRDLILESSQAGVDFAAAVSLYSLSGTVTDGTDPLAGVTLTAGGQSTVSDADGSYALAGLPAAEYELRPSLAAHAFAPDLFAVTVGPSQAGIAFVGTLQAYSVSGVVTDAAGQPLAEVQVTAGVAATATDATGAYLLSGLAEGTYEVQVSRSEYIFAPASQAVSLGPDQVCVNAVGTASTYTIAGTVTGTAGQPLADAVVTVGENAVTSASDGTYSCTGLLAGAYGVTVARDATLFASPTRTVTVGPDQAGVDFAGSTCAYESSVPCTYTTDGATATVLAYLGSGGTVNVPASIGGLPVTTIGASAFADCAALTDIVLPDSLTAIGDSAFAGCSGLTGVYCLGAAPTLGTEVFAGDALATVYYLPTGRGWEATFGDCPTALWPAPAISALSSTEGTMAGGVEVDITGTHLVGITAVRFGAAEARFQARSASTTTALSPAVAAGPVDVRLTTPAGISENTAADDYTFLAGTAVTAVGPGAATGLGTATVTVSEPTEVAEGWSHAFSVLAAGGTAPYRYAWTLAGQPAPDAEDSATYAYTLGYDSVAHPAAAADTTLACAVTDSASRTTATVTWQIVRIVDTDRPATAPEVSITPAAPCTLDDLVGSATGSVDPDGDTVTGYDYVWECAEADPATVTGTTLPNAVTRKGQTWVLTARAKTAPYGTELATGTPATAHVTIANTPPIAVSDWGLTVASTATLDLQLQVADPDFDEGAEALTFAVANAPANGTLTDLDAAAGTVTYVPVADPVVLGNDYFTFTVTDGSGATSPSALVMVYVAGTWLVTLEAGDADTPFVQFGVESAATGGYDDAFDLLSPPAGQQQTGRVAFVGDSTDALPADGLLRDVRSLGLATRWLLRVSAADQPVTLSWPAAVLPNAGLRLWQVLTADTLADPVGGTQIEMGTTRQLLVPAQSTRYFVIAPVVDWEVTLDVGWNMVSLPVEPDDPAVASVFADGDDGSRGGDRTALRDAQRGTVYAGSVWQWEPTASPAPAYAQASHIHALVGYWVYAPAAAVVTVRGLASPATGLTLAAGWNLIGTPSAVAAPRAPAYPTVFAPAWWWDGNAYRPAVDLVPGLAYWLYGRQETQWQFAP